MIIHKTCKINMKGLSSLDFFDEETKKFITDYLTIENEYRYALREMSAKLENVDDYCQTYFSHNPIHHMESRIKNPDSLVEKLMRRGFEVSIESLHENIYDVAGIRVICNYINDIYQITEILSKQTGIREKLRKDYILNPKDTGYRSLHMIYEIELNINGETKFVPVEIQFRTIAMDMWASLEHELRYKNNSELSDEAKNSLKKYSEDLYHVDLNMQKLYISTTVKENNEDD